MEVASLSDGSDQSFGDLWTAALAAYREVTQKGGESRGSRNTQSDIPVITTIDSLATKIEESSSNFQTFRARHSKVWNKLKLFAGPLASAINVLPIGDVMGVPVGTVIGSCVYLIRSCEEVSNAYDWLEQVFSELHEFSERLEIYYTSQMSPALRKKAIGILAFMLRVIGRSETLVKERRFRQYLRVTFLGKDEKTKQLLDDLNKLIDSEQRFLLAVTLANTQRVESKLDDGVAKLEAEVSALGVSLKKAEEKNLSIAAEQMIQTTLRSGAAAEAVEETFGQNKRELLKGTAEWLQHESHFQEWLVKTANVLWIFGGPGAGKTYLSTWIIQHLSDQQRDAHENTALAYFFVHENDDTRRDANMLLKTLALQILRQDTFFTQHVLRALGTRRVLATAEDTWEHLFESYYGNAQQHCKPVSVIIDGLDEAHIETQHTLANLIRAWSSMPRGEARNNMRFVVVGRLTLRFELNFTAEERSRFLEVSRSKNEKDIDSYVCKRLEDVLVIRELRAKKPGGPATANKLGREMRRKILRGSDGVFLWAKLLINTLSGKDLVHIKAILNDPPDSLDDMIWSVFARLEKDDELDHAMLKSMLTFAAYVKRPLKFGEMDLFLTLPGNAPNILLWKWTRGKLSSLFELTFPDGRDPDLLASSEESPLASNTVANDENTQEDDEPFDFSGDDDELSELDVDDDFLSPTDAQSLQTAALQYNDGAATDFLRYSSDEQMRTIVAFSHARIRDCLVSDVMSRKRGSPSFTQLPDSSNAHAQILVTCIDVLRLKVSLQDATRYLAEYPLVHLTDHLREMNHSSMPNDQLVRVIDGLYWLFGTEDGTKCFFRAATVTDVWRPLQIAFINTWVKTMENFLLVQSWLSVAVDRGILDQLEAGAGTWVRKAANSLADLLRPSMVNASKHWLQPINMTESHHLSMMGLAFWSLRFWYGHAEGDTSLVQAAQDFDALTESAYIKSVKSEEIGILARWAELPRNAFWHLRVGCLMCRARAYDEAIGHLEEALDDDKNLSEAYTWIANTYAEKKEFLQAIQALHQRIETLDHRERWRESWIWPQAWKWAVSLGDQKIAAEAAENGFRANPATPPAQSAWLMELQRREDLPEMMRVLHMMDEKLHTEVEHVSTTAFIPTGLTKMTWFSTWLIFGGGEPLKILGPATREAGQTSWALRKVKEAYVGIDPRLDWFVRFQLLCAECVIRAWFHDGPVDEEILAVEKFLTLWGNMPQHVSQLIGSQEFDIILTDALGQRCFDAAVALHGQEPHTAKMNLYSGKLKALATTVRSSNESTDQGFDFYKDRHSALLYGIWLRDYEKAKEKVWKKCFKVRVLEQMRCLDDDDPTNDAVGLKMLAGVLMPAGYRQDAAALLAILFEMLEVARKPTDASEEPTVPQEDTDNSGGISNPAPTNEADLLDRELAADVEKKLTLQLNADDVTYVCDNCDKGPLEVEEFFFCETCDDTNFCQECLAMLHDPSIRPGLKARYCNPVHKQYKAWPIPQEARNLAAQYKNGVTEVRREWLDRLRAEWLEA